MLRPRVEGFFVSIGLLAIRLVAGAAFMHHGLPKIQNPFNWMPGSSMPSILIALAAVAEFFGGISWVLGLFTPLFSLMIACTMGVAVSTHLGHGDPFIGHAGPSYEIAALYLAIAVNFLFSGPGKFSLDAWLFGKK